MASSASCLAFKSPSVPPRRSWTLELGKNWACLSINTSWLLASQTACGVPMSRITNAGRSATEDWSLNAAQRMMGGRTEAQ